jgi:hypothetical protein
LVAPECIGGDALKNVYERFAEKVAADAEYAARAAQPSAERELFAFLEGEWEWELQIPATAVTPRREARGHIRFQRTGYGISAMRPGGDPIPFLIYDPFSEMWILVMAEPTAYGILAGLGLRNGRVLFTGEMTLMGVTMRLRQTWIVESDSQIRLLSDEHIDGGWERVDEGSWRRLGG